MHKTTSPQALVVWALALVFVLGACSSPTTPTAADTDLVVDVRLACQPMRGVDRYQCDTEEEAQQGAEETGGTYGSMGSNGKWWYLPGLCTEDCT